MLNESDAACYPVCQKCRVAGICDRPKLPDIPEPHIAKCRIPSPNDMAMVLCACGCRNVPLPILMIAKTKNVICDQHGITRIVEDKAAKSKKKGKGKPQVAGQQEIPPF
jgi:hypothetical protein